MRAETHKAFMHVAMAAAAVALTAGCSTTRTWASHTRNWVSNRVAADYQNERLEAAMTYVRFNRDLRPDIMRVMSDDTFFQKPYCSLVPGMTTRQVEIMLGTGTESYMTRKTMSGDTASQRAGLLQAGFERWIYYSRGREEEGDENVDIRCIVDIDRGRVVRVLNDPIDVAQAACFADVPSSYANGKPQYDWCG